MRGLGAIGWLAVTVLGLGCGRLGIEPIDRADGGAPSDAATSDAAVMDAAVMDAAVMDAAVTDAAPGVDAASPADGGAASDGALPADAAPPADAAASVDSAAPPMDASAPIDAAVDAGSDAGPPPPGDFCESIPPLAAEPAIDGVLDPGLALREPPREGWTGVEPIPAEHRVAYAIGYRPDGLYFFVSVVDSTPVVPAPSEPTYWGDGVELYVDDDGAFTTAAEYDRPGTIQIIVNAPPEGESMAMQADRWNNVPTAFGPWTSTRFGSFRTTDGYAVEAFVMAADLGLGSWSLAAGQSVAVALGINVAEDTADEDGGAPVSDRLGQYFNRLASAPRGGCGTAPFCTAEAFCVTTLLP